MENQKMTNTNISFLASKEDKIKLLEAAKEGGFFEYVVIINDKTKETMTFEELIKSIRKHTSCDIKLKEKVMDNGFKGELHYKYKK